MAAMSAGGSGQRTLGGMGMGVSRWTRGVAAVLAVAVMATLPGCLDRPTAPGHAERWDTLWSYRTTLEDTVLLTPSWVAPFQDGVVVGDGNTPRVTAFGADGKVRWIYAPPRGDGPGEMRYAVDATETDDGLWVLASPPRLILLSDRGSVIRHVSFVPVPTRVVGELEGVEHGEAFLVMGRELARVSLADGRVVGHARAIPWAQEPPAGWVSAMNLASRDGLIAVGQRYGPEVVILQGDSLRGAILRPEITYDVRGQRVDLGNGMFMYQRPTGQIPFGAWGLALTDSELWVVSGGAWLNDRVGQEEQRLNDRLLVYSLDGDLIGERTLPFDTQDISVSNQTVYLLSRLLDPDHDYVLLALARR